MGCCCFCRAPLPLFAWKKGVFSPARSRWGRKAAGKRPTPRGHRSGRRQSRTPAIDPALVWISPVTKERRRNHPGRFHCKAHRPPAAARPGAGLPAGTASPETSSAAEGAALGHLLHRRRWEYDSPGRRRRGPREPPGSTAEHPPRLPPAPARDQRACAAALPRPPPENEVFPAPASNPGSGESREIVGIEWLERQGLDAGSWRQLGTAGRRAPLCRVRPWPGSGPGGLVSEERQRQSFTTVLGVFPGMNLLGIGQWWFAWRWLSGHRCLCREFSDIYIYVCVYVSVCGFSCLGMLLFGGCRQLARAGTVLSRGAEC